MDEIERNLIVENLSPLIRDKFENIGFISDDGIRYFRRNSNLVHYIIFSTDGHYLTFFFGEFLIHAPVLTVKSPDTINVSVFNEATNPITFKSKKHFKNASDKALKALIQIDAERFSQVYTESDYEDFHLRGTPSLEKIYYLTDAGRHEEVDAWLKLSNHQYRGLRCTKSYSDDKALDFYFDTPSNHEISFSKLSIKERIEFINNLRSFNISKNSLEYLYEAV